MIRRRLACCLVALACGFTAEPAARAAPPDVVPEFFEACVRHLQRTVVARPDGSHLARLFALRQLHDPSLRPLLHKVAQSGEWQIRVHGILGLAEIEQPSRIDPWLLSQVEAGARQTLIANAIDMKLLGREQMRQLVTSTDLDPMSRLLMLGELLLGGDQIDRETIEVPATWPPCSGGQLDVFEVTNHTIDSGPGRCNPAGKLARLGDLLHQRQDVLEIRIGCQPLILVLIPLARRYQIASGI